MNLVEVRRQLDQERRHLARDGEVLDVLDAVTRLRSHDGSRHGVTFSSLSAGSADAAIRGEVEHHRRLGVGFEWKLYSHDAPPDLLRRLSAHGLEAGPCEAVLVCDLGDPPAWVSATDAATVIRIILPEQVEVYRQVDEAVFGEADEGTAKELADAVRAASSQHRGYIAYSGDEPASVGRLYTHPRSRFAGLYGGGTRQPFRGRGFYRAVVAARARDAIASGARYLVVDALPTSRPILERLGFEWLTDTWPCTWRP